MQDSFRHRGRQRSGWFRTCTYRSTVDHKSLVVSLTYTTTLYKEVYKYGITWTSLRISTVWWGAIVPVSGGQRRGAVAKYDESKKLWASSTDKWISWRWFSSEQRMTKILNMHEWKWMRKKSLLCKFVLSILKMQKIIARRTKPSCLYV